MKLTIKRRIALLYTALTCALLAILLPIVYGSVLASLSLDIQSRLDSAVAQVSLAMSEEDGRLVCSGPLDLPDHILMQVKDADGALLYATAGSGWLEGLQADGRQNVLHRGEIYTVLWESFTVEESVVTATAAISSDYAQSSLRLLKKLLCLLVPVYLALSAAGAYLLARRAIRPIAEITRAAEDISAGDLSRRIAGIATRDEVQELADTFNAMLERLEESFARERQFTSDASHELRTPVAVISACAEELDGAVRGAEGAETLAVIRKETARMGKIISQLLMLTRGYEGRCHIEKEDLDLQEAVDSVMDELAETAAASRIRLTDLTPAGCLVYADQSLLTQLLINLIGNSIKYGVPGGRVVVQADAGAQGCTFSVSDDGIGIRAEELPHVFERFYRADKARDRTGSGLGLSIVQWIVQLHDGSVSIRSEYGAGTQVTVFFPARRTGL